MTGNKFILETDHKLLLAFFGENRSAPQLTAEKLQRWLLFLSNVNTDLSRLPLHIELEECRDEQMDYLNFVEESRAVDIQVRR